MTPREPASSDETSSLLNEMEPPASSVYLACMTIGLISTKPLLRPTRQESAEERMSRISREAEIIAEGRAQLDAGQGIPLEVLKTWLSERKNNPAAQLPVIQVKTPRVP